MIPDDSLELTAAKMASQLVNKISELFTKHVLNVLDSSSSGIRQWLSTLRVSLAG